MNELIAEILHLQELYQDAYDVKLLCLWSKPELDKRSALGLAKIYHELTNLLP